MQAKFAICLMAAAFSASACAAGTSSRAKFTVVPRVLCSPQFSSKAASIVLDAVAGASGKEEVAVKPSQCKVKAESDITFHATSKVDKAVVIFLADTPDNSCESPTPGNSPEKGGNPILVFPIYNGFVQPVSIKVNSDNKHFRYCVELGLDPMPNPAIIIKE